MDLPHSDACFVRAYPAAKAEAWMDGHVHAFAFFGGAPLSVLYDNDRCLVSKILPDGTRKRATLFSALQSHYLFRDRYGRPGKGNDKGSVEGIVGFTRRNHMVPIPRCASWEAFNADLEVQCRKRQSDILRGHKETIGERLKHDLAALKSLPAASFEACDQASGRVSSQSLVRYDTNDCSVPVAYGHRDVWIRGYVDQVVIGCRGEVIARHPRCYDGEDMVFDPIHYLPLIERKINALDQAAPLAEWDLPPEFAALRRLMEARMLKMGRREYVQVLRHVLFQAALAAACHNPVLKPVAQCLKARGKPHKLVIVAICPQARRHRKRDPQNRRPVATKRGDVNTVASVLHLT
jgi:hypothetical protein